MPLFASMTRGVVEKYGVLFDYIWHGGSREASARPLCVVI
jgi:hypothetical protein